MLLPMASAWRKLSGRKFPSPAEVSRQTLPLRVLSHHQAIEVEHTAQHSHQILLSGLRLVCRREP